MLVEQFRSIQEMADIPESSLPDFERFLRHLCSLLQIAPKHYPRGVFKFRSIEEAQEARKKHTDLKPT